MPNADDNDPATFVLIPGAGGAARYWYRLGPELKKRGHESVAVDLPAADDTAGLEEYVAAVLGVVGEHQHLVVVAQSMGALTGPLVCARTPADLLVLVNPMIPKPGETGGEWWANTGHAEARIEQAKREGRPPPGGPNDIVDAFFNDVPQAVREEIMSYGEPPQSGTPFGDPWPLDRWPHVPTKVLHGTEDRFFPIEFQRRVTRDRLGLEVDEMPGGHLIALSQPAALADRLDTYWRELP